MSRLTSEQRHAASQAYYATHREAIQAKAKALHHYHAYKQQWLRPRPTSFAVDPEDIAMSQPHTTQAATD